MKIADILVVEGVNNKISDSKIKEVLTQINITEVQEVIISKVHVPNISEDSDLIGIHVIVREVAET